MKTKVSDAELEAMVLQEVKNSFLALSWKRIALFLKQKNIPSPYRTAKEIIWKLVEEDKLCFDKDWNVTLKCCKYR